MNALKKTAAILIAFAMSASVFAGTDMDTRVHELEKKMDMMSTTTAAGTFGPKTALARAEPDGKGWFLSLDALYWQSKVGKAQYASSVSSYTNAVVLNATVLEPKFNWAFGFKAGVGYNFCHDGWDTHAEYTYFRNNASDTTTVSTPAAIIPKGTKNLFITASSQSAAASGIFGAYFATESHAHLRLSLNDLIVDLGRSFFVSKNLALRPNMGLKASWITLTSSQRFTGGGTAYTYTAPGISGGSVAATTVTVQGLGSNTVYNHQKQEMFGLGPRAGVDTKWVLGNDISIYGNVTGALLFSYFKQTGEINYSVLPANIITISDKWHRLIPTVDFELGLMYDSYIMCDTQHFSISLGYENQYFWNASYIGVGGDNFDLSDGIGMYGVNLKVRWDF